MNYKKIYIATGNPSKLSNFKKIFFWISPDIEAAMVPQKIEVEENAATLTENSRLKVTPYEGLYDIPVIANDFGLEFDEEFVELQDVARIKRQALGDSDEAKLSDKEIGTKMFNFYRDTAEKYGGEIPCKARDVFSIIYPNGEIKQKKSVREYVLTDRMVEEFDIHHPLDSLRISLAVDKYMDEFSEGDEKVDKKPLIEAIRKLV
jgi:hypothetical protein